MNGKIDWQTAADQLAEKGYTIIDNYLSPDEVINLQNISKERFQSGHFQSAGVGRKKDFTKQPEVRGDQIHWLEENTSNPLIKTFWKRIDDFILEVNRSCYLGIRSKEFHFAIYPEGKAYKRHLDVFRSSDARRISVIIYLNPEWQADWGGNLKLYLDDETIDVLPMGGRMVCFRSELIEHEVLAVTQPRYSLTGWLRNDDKVFGNL